VQQQIGITPESTTILSSIAEQLKVPLTTIARSIELGQLHDDPGLLDMGALHLQTQAALTLVDSYLLGLQLLNGQGQLALEPVSVASTLTDTAHELSGFARQYNVTLEVQIAGRYGPVMAHHAGLRAALLSLGYGLLATPDEFDDGPRRVVLAAHRTERGIVAGLYGEHGPTASQWRKALELCGRARQPLATLAASSGAGLFVADAILQAMATRLRVGRHHRQVGLATTLLPSQQLRLV